MEGAQKICQVHDRFAFMTVTLVAFRITARIVIHQYRANDRGKVATHAVSVVIENRDDPINITRTRIAGDQPLNQLTAEKRADVRIVENSIERHFQILLRRLVCWDRYAIKDLLRHSLMMSREWNHRIDVVRSGAIPNRCPRLRIVPAGENGATPDY